jgi:hypothetical protein
MPAIPSSGAERGISPAFDVYGRDLPTASATDEHMYCVQYRLNWIADPTANMIPGALIHAEVRVFWARLDRQPIGDCSSVVPSPDAANAPQHYHFVYLTTAIRQNPDQ